MVRQALERNSNKGIRTNERSKFIQRAEMNGIRVVYIEDVRLGVRTLRPPFLKVEDHSRKYRPLILERLNGQTSRTCFEMTVHATKLFTNKRNRKLTNTVVSVNNILQITKCILIVVCTKKTQKMTQSGNM